MIVIAIVLTSDTHADETTFAWRDLLLRKFFKGIHPRGMEKFSEYDERRGFCSGWQGIACINGEVKEVHYSRETFGNFNIDTLPATVTTLHISICGQNFSLRTRCLPRELINLRLPGNDISGIVDLGHFPTNLEAAILRGNQLKGPIDFTMLPRNLKVLDLRNNIIHQHTVYYDNLPERIELIQLLGNNIQKTRAVNGRSIGSKHIFTWDV